MTDAEERRAREQAEQARDRTRRLQELTAALSSVLDRDQVISIVVDAGRGALGAAAGFAWMLRDDNMIELAAAEHDAISAQTSSRLTQFRTLSMTDPLPVCDVIRSAMPMMFESLEAMGARYPLAGQPGSSPFRAWVVMPFVVDGRGIGAASFSFQRERTFSADDRELLAAMIGQASLALERCRLIEAERRAHAAAEQARLRERQLHVIAARLSSALTQEQVASIACQECVAFLGAVVGIIALREGDELLLLASAGTSDAGHRSEFSRIPLAASAPSTEAVRTQQLVWCASEAELTARYPELERVWRSRGIRSWGAIPFSFGNQAIGCVAIAYGDERPLALDVRAFLHAVGQLASQALERARLFEAHRQSEERLRLALTAARAATWSVDIASGTSTRDASYSELVGQRQARVAADFMSVHPDDRPIAQAAYQRTLDEGVPYEPEVRIRRDDGTYMWIRAHGRLVYGADGKPTTLAGVIVDIDQAKQARLRAEEERRINDTLNRLAAMFASELDHDRLVQLITVEVTKLVGAEVCAFFADGHERAIATGDHTLLADLRELATTRIGSVLAVPVAARSGGLFGRLVVGHTQQDRFTDHHGRLIANVASQAAVALENARLYKTIRDQNEQLALAIERARQSDRRKDEFLAMLSHELRNPLAPITTALELMELKDGADTKERAVIRRQVAHLSRLIDDLLDVSRVTRGKIQLAREVTEVSTVLAKAIEMASPLLEKRMQRLAIVVPRTGLLVDADPARLAQVFQNLLTNAAKYSDVHARIELAARADGDSVIVEVRDQGIGIAPELLPHLFDLFVQGERALDRSEGGLGIGLTIARSLCELHGGTISATSPGVGRGSTFTIKLPRITTHAAASVPAQRADGRRSPVLAGATRVLVVDDNVDAAHMLRDFLAAIGHEPAVAHDGPAALELATTFEPDIAVLDIGLPVMNGYELARQLRERLGSDKLRLIAVTGYGQDADRARAREVGFDHHLIKPIELDALLSLLDK